MERMTATSPPIVSTSLAPITVHANFPDTVIMAVFASVCLRLSKLFYCHNFLNIAFIYFFFDEQDGVSTYKEQTLHQKYHDPPSLLLLIFHFCRNSKLLNKVSVLNKNLSNFYAPALLCLSGRSRHALSLPFTPCGVE